MKHRYFARPLLLVLAAILLAAGATEAAPGKPIRLRNAAALEPTVPAKSASQQQPLSGLYVLQFAAAPSVEQRDGMLAAGIDLLRPIPEDSFLARLKQVPLQQLYATWGVTFAGRYGPEHKQHPSLTTNVADELSIAILVQRRSSDTEKQEVRGRFRRIDQESSLRSGAVLRGRVSQGNLRALANMESVLWIEPSRSMKLFDEVASKIVAGDAGPGRLVPQDLGFDGSGVSVAVADSGLNNGDALSMHPDLFGRTPRFFHYGTNLWDAADEHSHGTHVAGIVAGNGATGELDENGALYGLGVAPGASIIAQRIFDAVGNYEAPPSYERLTRDALRAGADIGSNSWGDDNHGQYDISAMEFDELVRDGDALALGDQAYILEFSAGNAGPLEGTIGTPAVAKNVIATGASGNDRPDYLFYAEPPEAIASFSSRGPCADGRIKPDLVAPGTYIASLQSASATDQYAWAPISANYQFQGGTSQAGPHVSGAAAVFVDYYRQTHSGQTPSPALVKAALINSTIDMDDSFGTLPVPNNDEGWGRLDLTYLFDPAANFTYFDSIRLTNTQVFETDIVVVDASQPLRITLAYSDVPGFPGASKALVNDLDLEVVGPFGTVYRGNQMEFGESVANPTAADDLNNVEGVLIYEPKPGLYVVRVRATRLLEDALVDTASVVEQDFALVTSASLAPPGYGVIGFDRNFYRQPDKINIHLADTDLAGRPTASITLRSTTESPGETIVLNSARDSGVFTGAVATVTGPALADGKLQIYHGSLIEAIYSDASGGRVASATAHADFVPPVISGVGTNNQFGLVQISWVTDEPANSIVHFGTNLNTASFSTYTNSTLETAHLVNLGGLEQERTYYFYLVGIDEAGNVATNKNGTNLFSIYVKRVPVLLLVDAFSDMFGGADALPLSGYTNALNEIGIGYEVWSVTNLGSPPLAALSAYRGVIWRLPELDGTWSASERVAISNYLDSGGSLFVASMEVFSRLEEVGATNFTKNVLRVDSFIPDAGVPDIIGGPDPITAGIDEDLDYAPYDVLWYDFIQFGLMQADISDTFVAGSAASAILRTTAGGTVGLRWPGSGQSANGKLVLLSFPLDAVPMTGPNSPRVNLLRNILEFLVPGGTGEGNVRFGANAYKLPSRPTVELGDLSLYGRTNITVNVWSTTDPTRVSVTLKPSKVPGVFTGSFGLVSATNPPASGTVRAAHNDDLVVEYAASPTNAPVTAMSKVDTELPLITFVDAEPDYVNALVFWTTSEDTDGFVQYGESAFLNKNYYTSEVSTDHEVQLDGLVPDRTYYYRVTSRDVAGNISVGPMQTFRTLKPEMTPWSDDLETGATKWSTFVDPDTYVPGVTPEWQLGRPNNQIATNGHSPQNAWGCNLTGAAMDYAECFLISPAIYITNGNIATLKFWHNYDFMDITGFDIEYGELGIIANNQAMVSLAAFGDSSYDWVEEEINLTPYIGKVVYLVWHYVLFTFDAVPRPGWLVDDVSIETQAVVPGTIYISNNIPQATYLLSGTSSRKGKGLSQTITNAPPGPYIMEYAQIAHYQEPAAQTNVLQPGSSITFVGIYVPLDANQNGIPDPWEASYFGIISTNRTGTTDSDGDGMTDLAEYKAGTDPTSPLAAFRVTVSRVGNTLRYEWPAIIGWNYRLRTGSSPANLLPALSWTQAVSNKVVVTIPIPAGPGASFARVEGMGPTERPTGVPGTFRIAAATTGGGLELNWAAVSGRKYRVETSTNMVSWAALSGWITPAGTNGSYAIGKPALTGVSYRMQVEEQ